MPRLFLSDRDRPAAKKFATHFCGGATRAAAKGGKHHNHRSCAQLQAMMDHGLTGGKHADDGVERKAKIEKKMRKKGCQG
ncbi:hypothetical protein [Rhizobium sp. NLR22b]|uniref:hypothetical protein n=1 Tax=unclassified Rhizobium TaxID=2613769 RepID=UPI00386C1DC6